MRSLKKCLYGVICLLCLAYLSVSGRVCPVSGQEMSGSGDSTLLMFVGEDLHVLSIASRREESAWEAPAVAQVVTRETFTKWGADALSDVLDRLPGFYMAPKEWGQQPYLRGIPDSVLFLYDTVPVDSDTTKSFHPLDAELNLNAVKRIEVIRGPGSVLWGADAFAGIVNVVPMSGKDLDGVESGVMYGTSREDAGVYANWGTFDGFTDAFVSVYARQLEMDDTACTIGGFWGDGVAPVRIEDRFVAPFEPGTSQFAEVTGRLTYRDWLSASFRLSDADRRYGVRDSAGEISWEEEQETPHLLVKFETRRELSPVSAVRFMGAYSRLKTRHRIVDYTFRTRESVVYGELLYDRSLFNGGSLLTTGISSRGKTIKDAVIWQYYLPDYLKNSPYFPPPVERVDYDDTLYSAFSQYRHRFGSVDLWGGVRFDSHDSYEDNTSFSTGLLWTPDDKLNFKVQYGTAYRTPFSRQLREATQLPALERIECLNVQAAWRPNSDGMARLTLFDNRIDHHVMEDIYAGAGLSLPNHQRIQGGELEFSYQPMARLAFSGNLTLMKNTGPDETYRYNDYSFILPDGSLEKHYADLYYDYDAGPDGLASLRADWALAEWVDIGIGGRYIAERMHIHALDAFMEASSPVWLVDMSFRFRLGKNRQGTCVISIDDLFDRGFEYPATYYRAKRDGRSVQFNYHLRF